MKVYVVREIHYSGYNVHAIVERREDAEKFLAWLVSQEGVDGVWCDIHEVDTEAGLELMKGEIKPYRMRLTPALEIRIDRKFGLKTPRAMVSEDGDSTNLSPRHKIYMYPGHKRLFDGVWGDIDVYCWAANEREAMRIGVNYMREVQSSDSWREEVIAAIEKRFDSSGYIARAMEYWGV